MPPNQRWSVGQLEALLALLERQLVGPVAVDLVGRQEDERRRVRVQPGGLEHVERPVGVDREVGLGLGRRPVVGRLRRGVHDDLDLAAVLGEHALDPLRVADVDVDGAERVEAGGEPLGDGSRGRARAEEHGPHVVVDPDHAVPGLREVLDGLGAHESPRASHDRHAHLAYPSRVARTARSFASIQASVSARMARASRRGRQSVRPCRRRAVGQVDAHVAGALLVRLLDGHLVAGQLAAQLGRLGERQAHVAAAADVDGGAGPVTGPHELVVDQVDQVADVEQVADLLALAAVADVAQVLPEAVGEQPIGEDALVDLAHLPGPGDHAAAVDDGLHAERRGVLGDQQLAASFVAP